MGTMVREIENGCYRKKSTTGLYRRVPHFTVVQNISNGGLSQIMTFPMHAQLRREFDVLNHKHGFTNEIMFVLLFLTVFSHLLRIQGISDRK
jgi:hypothetical protein